MNADLFLSTITDDKLKKIASDVFSNVRLQKDDGLYLFKHANLPYLSILSTHIKEAKTGNKVFFNRNMHFEPTNICIYNCKFCSYRREEGEEGSWEYHKDLLVRELTKFKNRNITEIHITGGVHPKKGLEFYTEILKTVKELLPQVHAKAFSAVEIHYISRYTKLDYRTVLLKLKEAGLDSIPGGGAELFDEKLRKQICPDKASSSQWLEIHKTAHQLGLSSNATMLYGHIETYEHRIDHLNRLRTLQDETKGFGTFIPLKFKRENNLMSDMKESTMLEDLRNFAISRIYLDNFMHIKAYWPMIGKNLTQLALSFGVDDVDGTIDDTTKIYSMAGAEDKNPSMSSEELINLIKTAHRIPVERDTLFNELNVY